MTENFSFIKTHEDPNEEEKTINGFYGDYSITQEDRIEVQRYRISVLICSLSMIGVVISCLKFNNSLACLSLIILSISIGFALYWIHIYIREIHLILKSFWLAGSISLSAMILILGFDKLIPSLIQSPQTTIAIAPLFVSLTGLGFKEFFCFRRPEAIGVSIVLPIAILGHIFSLLSSTQVIFSLGTSSILLFILAIRKFGIDPGADIGDKSVFEYMKQQRERVKV